MTKIRELKSCKTMLVEVGVLLNLAKGKAELNSACNICINNDNREGCDNCPFGDLMCDNIWNGYSYQDNDDLLEKRIVVEKVEQFGKFEQVDTKLTIRIKSVECCPWGEKSIAYNLVYLEKTKEILIKKIKELEND